MGFAIILAVLFVGAAYGGVIEKVETADSKAHACKCGVMSSKDPNANPEMEHSIKLDVTCDVKGKEKCSNLCKVLAETAKVDKERQEKFCKAMKKDIKLKPSLFISVCNAPYTYSGLTIEEPVCCKGGKYVKC